MPYIVAALVAAISLLAEQHWRQRLWFTVPASGWWTMRLIVEAGIAVALVAALRQVPTNVLSLNGTLLGIVAGLAAPRAFGRTQLPVFQRNLNVINLAYERATEPLDQLIDETSAEAQRIYVRDVIRPAARDGRLDLTEIAEAFRQHLGGRHLMTEVERTERLKFINDITGDTVADDQKVGALVLKAWEIGAYKALQAMLRPLPRRRYGAIKTIRTLLRRLRIGKASS